MTKFYNKKSVTKKRKYLRNNMTHAEVILWTHLKAKQLGGMKFRRQHSIGPYILDFYCPQIKLAIEVDGLTHDFNNRRKLDVKREEFLKNFNVRLIRFSNNDIYGNLNGVLNKTQT